MKEGLALSLLLSAIAAQAQPVAAPEPPPSEGQLQRSDARLMLDYQTVRVRGDASIDLMGLHLYKDIADGISIGAGLMGPLVSGQYGGFMGASVGLQMRKRLGGPVFGLLSVAAGAGAGGRSPEHAKRLAGSGAFARGQLGLGYDFGDFSVGAGVSALKFRRSLIDSRQLDVFVDIPFSYLSGPHRAHGRELAPDDDARAAREMGESMLSFSLDNYQQLHATGTYRGTVRSGEFQFAHYLAPDLYWFANFASAYSGLPTYNQLLGGLGRRWRVTRDWTLYAQLGLGSGGYAPEQIDTGPGLLVYPKLSAEVAITPTLGLAVSAGYLSAPKGSSRNPTYGLTLTRHLRAGRHGNEAATPARYEGLRLTLLHQTDAHLRFRGTERPALQMLGLQIDMPVNERWYLPMQASAAYNSYLGYPGYAELFAGIGWQSPRVAGERWQVFGQLMGGANVHGKGGKFNVGVRALISDRLALSLSAGRIEARSGSGGRYEADNWVLGLDYRFAIPTRQ